MSVHPSGTAERDRLIGHALDTIRQFLASELRAGQLSEAEVEAAVRAEAALAGGTAAQIYRESQEARTLLAKLEPQSAAIVGKVMRHTKLALHTFLQGEFPAYVDQPLFDPPAE
jgi:hypothetical protein